MSQLSDSPAAAAPMTNGRHPPIPPIPPLALAPHEERLAAAGYRALLADYCQLVDQVANLSVFAIATWESLQQVRNLLDLPRQPLPLSTSLALASKPALPPTSAPAAGAKES